jgi:lipopolysaccharide biosynthesis glycosyltransferase
MTPNTAIITLLDDGFLPGAKVFLRSLIQHNPDFNLPFIILDAGVSPNTLDTLKEIYPNTELRQIEKENYARININAAPEKLRKTFYTFDVFIQPENRLVFFDMDTLVLGDISELLHTHHTFAAVRCYTAGSDKMTTPIINSGVFVVNKNKCLTNIYEQLLSYPASSSPDQDAINHVFRGQIHYLPKKYNVEKRILHSRRHPEYKNIKNITVLHFVGIKPWQERDKNSRENSYREYEKLWHKYNQ